MKIKILINLPGTIDNGFFSPERGESRWAQNLAWMLAKKGHKVWCASVSKPVWGKSQEFFSLYKDNVTFCNLYEAKDESKREEFDVLFDPSWFHPGMTEFYRDFNSKVFIHGHWGGCCYDEPGRFPDERHYIAYPNLQVVTSMRNCAFRHADKHIFLPMPLMFPACDVEDVKDSIAWGVKECFFARKSIELREHSKYLLTLFLQLLKLGSKISRGYVINSEQMFNAPENDMNYVNSPLVQSLKINSNIICLPTRTSYSDIVNRVLRYSKILFRTGEPPGAPLEYEAISQGCLPLVWRKSENVFVNYYDMFGLTIEDTDNTSLITEKVMELTFNKRIREVLYHTCLNELNIHYDYDFIEGVLLELLRR